MPKESDSTEATLSHIYRVRELIEQVKSILTQRSILHDKTKLEDPEKPIFDITTDRLKNSTYGSPEYKSFLDDMSVALDHHYKNNRHHPEHYPNGIAEMTLIDLLEMLCDWKAATERHTDGDIRKSVVINRDRFNISPDIEKLLNNTIDYLGY